MAKKSMIERDKKRRTLVAKHAARRAAIKEQFKDENLSLADRVRLSMKLAKMPRNSSATRIRNRCQLTGRPRGYYRKLKVSRIALRDLGGKGQIPGLVKSSW